MVPPEAGLHRFKHDSQCLWILTVADRLVKDLWSAIWRRRNVWSNRCHDDTWSISAGFLGLFRHRHDCFGEQWPRQAGVLSRRVFLTFESLKRLNDFIAFTLSIATSAGIFLWTVLEIPTFYLSFMSILYGYLCYQCIQLGVTYWKGVSLGSYW